MAINAADVKALRDKTDLPMMECKQALIEANGDQEKAIELLRKKARGQIAKRAERETAEGRVAIHTDSATGRAGMVELLCETAPVAGTADFVRLANLAAQVAASLPEPTPAAIMDHARPDGGSGTLHALHEEVVNKIRENIRLGRCVSMSGHIGRYVHHDNMKGVLVEFTAPCPEEAAADVCMHIAAMRPPYVRREDVDPKAVEEQRGFALEQVKGKPENIVEKIVAGKLDKWYAEIVLLEQPFVKDDKRSVGQFLRGINPDLTVRRVARIDIKGA